MMPLYPWLQPYYQKIIHPFLQQKGHHALLIKSEPGIGIEQLCQAVINWLMCQTPQNDIPCEQCHSCQLHQANNHPDVYKLVSIDDKEIGVDQIRQLIEKVNQHAQQSGNKVVYIQSAERLTESAANALLKTLEEPRPQTYFILQNESSTPMLPTVHSRCQTWHIGLPSTNQTIEWLQHQTNRETHEILTALAMNLNRPLPTLQALQENLTEQRKNFLRQFWLYYRYYSPLELLPSFDKEREKALVQSDWILAFLQDALKHKLAIQQHWQSLDLTRGIIQFSEQQTIPKLLKALRIMQKVRSDLISINTVNQELILLEGLTRLITEVFEE
ncbi:DNA polymerase III subunit delta' [Rodentibacter caecimuris]|uniref:DNA polymerase III subunit delta' n=1 Tax=Rodentibacter caecimuris TaxID=1796644 RepID=A0ABX3KWV3_9PAST|nr:DNA polymerase III subunit delta' [Rodentibacter heylii]